MSKLTAKHEPANRWVGATLSPTISHWYRRTYGLAQVAVNTGDALELLANPWTFSLASTHMIMSSVPEHPLAPGPEPRARPARRLRYRSAGLRGPSARVPQNRAITKTTG